MSDGRRWLALGVALAVVLRVALHSAALGPLLGDRVELATPVTALARVREARWRVRNQLPPYAGDIYHQSPLVYLALGPLLDYVRLFFIYGFIDGFCYVFAVVLLRYVCLATSRLSTSYLLASSICVVLCRYPLIAIAPRTAGMAHARALHSARRCDCTDALPHCAGVARACGAARCCRAPDNSALSVYTISTKFLALFYSFASLFFN